MTPLPLRRICVADLYHFVGRDLKDGPATGMRGDCTGLSGDCTVLSGDCTDIPTDERPCEIADWVEP